MTAPPCPRQLLQCAATTFHLLSLVLSLTAISATASVLPRSRGTSRHHLPSAFTFLGLPIPALPNIEIPSSPIEVKLVYQRVIDPMYVEGWEGRKVKGERRGEVNRISAWGHSRTINPSIYTCIYVHMPLFSIFQTLWRLLRPYT